jgi:hypothetical protein
MSDVLAKLNSINIATARVINLTNSTNQSAFSEQTQCSMFVQEFKTMLTLTKQGVGGDGTRFNNQKDTNLCTSFSGVTHIRWELISFFDSFNLDIKSLLKNDPQFSHYQILAEFCTIVYPKSLDKLIKNNSAGDDFTSKQKALLENVGRRLVYPTLFEVEGIKRLPTIVKLFDKKFMSTKFPSHTQAIQQLPAINNLILNLKEVHHPASGNVPTFQVT